MRSFYLWVLLIVAVFSFLGLMACGSMPISMDAIGKAAAGDWEGAARQAGNDAVDYTVNQEIYVKAIDMAYQEQTISWEERNRRVGELQEAYRHKNAGYLTRQDFHWKAVGLCTVGNQNYFDRLRAQQGW